MRKIDIEFGDVTSEFLTRSSIMARSLIKQLIREGINKDFSSVLLSPDVILEVDFPRYSLIPSENQSTGQIMMIGICDGFFIFKDLVGFLDHSHQACLFDTYDIQVVSSMILKDIRRKKMKHILG